MATWRRPTLLELFAFVLALTIGATFISPQWFRPRRDPDVVARSDIDHLGAALETYRYDTGHYPTTAQGLAALVTMPAQAPRPENWYGPYVRPAVPNDPSGHAYVYRRSDTSEAYSLDRPTSP